MELLSGNEIEELEREVQRALRRRDYSALDVIGYGEVTTVLRLRARAGDLACKRLTPFPDRSSALRCAGVIRGYVEALSRCGVEVVETDVALVPGIDGREVLYCVQPFQSSESLGPAFLRRVDAKRAVQAFERILHLLQQSVSSELAPDGQLSNWVFVGDRILYLDVSSPFQRDEQGDELFDWKLQLRALPAPLRWPVRRFALPGLLDNYHSLRGQALDFLGNLKKENLAHLIPVFLPVANHVLALDPPVEEEDIRAHYRADARTYAWLQALRRADRWLSYNVLRRDYPYLLPPRIDRRAG